ncbi:hypothetical protein AVEN_81220-1 [Araneus ventricosus]|uniref:RNase H type-1 domain-containing protein n=2 Tax=Araneus ventricosus TaxID=182803 RepID=A0A4Y2V8I5_ARAVE|nr:hypothetical protein AVEN_32249-1 [Araneus ventricosus]GBO20880.1 hypothetical protein AVEN_81220-1 [Araneus ventricosus]
MVGLSWVKDHVGILANELADHHAKLVITSGEDLFIPAAYSQFKRLLKNYAVEKWNQHWNSYDSASGIREEAALSRPPESEKILLSELCLSVGTCDVIRNWGMGRLSVCRYDSL